MPSGVGNPSHEMGCAHIANELANPNTALGTMNVLFDYIAFDGDLPNADNQEALRLTFQPVTQQERAYTSPIWYTPNP